MPREDANKEQNADAWANQAHFYANHASRLTELHAADLISLLTADIGRAGTILDVGGGTGAFVKAYIQQFPAGIPGQTLIVSDLSAGMLDKAQETTIIPANNNNNKYQTKIVFQQEDGTQLQGIADDSVDIVVSLFGVFLIPDQEATCRAICRVLKRQHDIFANASWIMDTPKGLTVQGFGVSLQEAFRLVKEMMDPTKQQQQQQQESSRDDNDPIYAWSTRDGARDILSNNYQFTNVQLAQAMHTSPWKLDNMWTMMLLNPVMMSNPATASPEQQQQQQQRAKAALQALVTQEGKFAANGTLLLTTASILAIGRGIE